MSSYTANYYPASAGFGSIPVIPSPHCYSTLKGYTENEFGFMKFNPPLSDPLSYPYERKDDPVIKYIPNYNTLCRSCYDDNIKQVDYRFASISHAYPIKEDYKTQRKTAPVPRTTPTPNTASAPKTASGKTRR